jgi:hypothetical protein
MRRLALLAAALLAQGCVSRVDPDADGGRFSCATGADCGSGWECKAQFSGGSLCFRLGECLATEVCNQADDTCDGRVDEGFALASDALNCGACGHVCPGGTACADAGCFEVACSDGVDNDANGLFDCADPACLGQRCDADAGRCQSPTVDAGTPDAGPAPPVACFPP